MKTRVLGMFVLSATLGAWAIAAEITTTRTITGGTITEFVPSRTVVVRSQTSAEPIRYIVTSDTRFVDEAGAPIAVQRINTGLPVTIHYVREGDRMLASRIVVHRESTMTKARAKALREYYEELEKSAPTEPEKAQAKALHEYYDELEEKLKD